MQKMAWFEPHRDYFVLELPGMELHIVTTPHGIGCAWWTFVDEGWHHAHVGLG